MSAILIYSDGSADTKNRSASACILVDRRVGRRLKVCVLHAVSGGPEAELIGGILGLVMAEACEYPPTQPILWCLDSTAVIDHAQGILSGNEALTPLWQCWKALASSRALSIRWIRGHNGQRENEACDRACHWIRFRGEEFLRERGEGPLGLGAKQSRGTSWHFFHAPSFRGELSPMSALEDECRSLHERISASLRPIMTFDHGSKV